MMCFQNMHDTGPKWDWMAKAHHCIIPHENESISTLVEFWYAMFPVSCGWYSALLSIYERRKWITQRLTNKLKCVFILSIGDTPVICRSFCLSWASKTLNYFPVTISVADVVVSFYSIFKIIVYHFLDINLKWFSLLVSKHEIPSFLKVFRVLFQTLACVILQK